ncbi:hypothetical protein EVA_18459 [gut metagenome]|uniref:Uncharacterized protein n=1 Tax=gut metagenome TaxID=749906 RepID=J9FG76_9ZZZZ
MIRTCLLKERLGRNCPYMGFILRDRTLRLITVRDQANEARPPHFPLV